MRSITSGWLRLLAISRALKRYWYRVVHTWSDEPQGRNHMKKLVLFGLIIARSPASGCIISSERHGTDAATITAHWDIKHGQRHSDLPADLRYRRAVLAGDRRELQQRRLADDRPLRLQRVHGRQRAADPDHVLQLGRDETHDGSQTYASTVSAFVDLTTTDKTFSADIYDRRWLLPDGVAADAARRTAPRCCARTRRHRRRRVVSTATVGSSQAIVDKFKCEDHYGVTSVLPEGTYTVSIDAFNHARRGDRHGRYADEQDDHRTEHGHRPPHDHDPDRLAVVDCSREREKGRLVRPFVVYRCRVWGSSRSSRLSQCCRVRQQRWRRRRRR